MCSVGLSVVPQVLLTSVWATHRELRRRIDVIHNRDELAVSNGNKLNLSEMFPAKL